MSWGWWLLIAAVVVLLLLYLSSTAGRLDRMHRRVELSHENLVYVLAMRHRSARAVAALPQLPPAAAGRIRECVALAVKAEQQGGVAQSVAESQLTAVLVAEFDDPELVDVLVKGADGKAVLSLADACRRVQIGHRFYNNAVSTTRSQRVRMVVRLFRLQGSAAMPQTMEFDDSIPAGFVGH